MIPDDWTGVLLVGGASRRMGRDKLLLELPDGRRLVEIAAAALAEGCADCIAAGLRREHRPWLTGFRGVADALPGAGPLGGLVAGLEAAGTRWALVLAGDLAAVGPWLRCLQAEAERDPERALLPVDAEGRLQPLAAAWPTALAASLREALLRGRRALRDVLDPDLARPWPYEEARRAARLDDPFRNINRPEDWAEFRRRP